jgi:dTDP-4-dehydrorhamnose 3,5-epimerase-like enzyme
MLAIDIADENPVDFRLRRSTRPSLSVHPLDPALAISWPLPIDNTDLSQISAKDANLPNFPG